MSYDSSVLPSPLGSTLTPSGSVASSKACQVLVYRISVTLWVGLRCSPSSSSTTSTFVLLLFPPSFCRSCAEYIHTTQGLESLLAWAFPFPNHFDTALVSEGERLKVTYVPRERDDASPALLPASLGALPSFNQKLPLFPPHMLL